MSKALRGRVRPWTQCPGLVRRRRDRQPIVLPTVDTYRQQMDHLQSMYERLQQSYSRRTAHTLTTSSSNGLTSLHRPHMKRSHTFAAGSGPSLSNTPVRSSGELSSDYGHRYNSRQPESPMPSVDITSGRGHGHRSHQPESVILSDEVINECGLIYGASRPKHMPSGEQPSMHGHRYDLHVSESVMPSVELPNGRGNLNDSYYPEPDIMENDDYDQMQTGTRQTPTLMSPHPSRPLAFSYPLSSNQSENVRYVGRKYGWMKSPSHTSIEPAKKAYKEDETSSSGVSSDNDVEDGVRDHHLLSDLHRNDQNGENGLHDSVDILQLCQHLKTQGLGEPVMSTQSHTSLRTSLPPGVRARCLPRDPSTREKIKGRARLDYEMANLRAVAFCEQQHPRAFRTASADFKNRDLRLLEEEERENVQRDLYNAMGNPNGLDDDDDDSSLVGSPLSREELFTRIEAWADDVHRALNRGHSFQGT